VFVCAVLCVCVDIFPADESQRKSFEAEMACVCHHFAALLLCLER